MAARKRHIPRPVVPWRSEHLTVCGLDLDGREQVSRQEVAATLAAVVYPPDVVWETKTELRLAALAEARICWTCTEKASHFRPWDRDPVGVVRIEADRGVNWFHGNGTVPREQSPLELELRVIADLIAAHRGEFDDLIERYQVMATLTAPPPRLRAAR